MIIADQYFTDASEPLLGDILVIVGTIFLAMSNVGMIGILKKYSSSSLVFFSSPWNDWMCGAGAMCEEERPHWSYGDDWGVWHAHHWIMDVSFYFQWCNNNALLPSLTFIYRVTYERKSFGSITWSAQLVSTQHFWNYITFTYWVNIISPICRHIHMLVAQ